MHCLMMRFDLPHLLDAHQVAVVAVAVDPHRDVEIDAGRRRRKAASCADPTRPPSRAASAPVKPERLRALGRHHADADRALLPDAVVGEQRFVFVDALREAV